VKPDDGYISEYLVHWTGKDGDDAGARIISVIASTCQLLLSYNVFHVLDIYNKIREKMICFTDVPLALSAQHCSRYGRFGIAFHKIRLMIVGTQPVFYATQANKHDLDVIFNFLQSQNQTKTIDPPVLDALLRHFYFMQIFSYGEANNNNAYYYEREWRLGKQNLAPVAMWDHPDNPKYRIIQAGYPRHCGKLFIDGEDEYFQFYREDVAFLICPQAWKTKIQNPYGFPIQDYEEYVSD
jgi:hypothetical protein